MTSRPVFVDSRRGTRASPVLLASLVCLMSGCPGTESPPPVNDSRPPGVARLELDRARLEPGASIRFSCTASDPEGDAVTYVFDWGAGGTLASSEQVASGVSAQVEVSIPHEGNYQARCRAVDVHGGLGGWSPALDFAVVDSRPEGTATLTLEVVGQGTLSSLVGGLDCPGTCATRLATGAIVVLEATPAPGWRYLGLSACEGTSRRCELRLEGDRVVTARFAPEVDTVLEWQRTGATRPGVPTWSPDGESLVVLDGGVSGGVLRIWDVASGRVKRVIPPIEEARFLSAAWSPTRNRLAAGLTDGTLVLLDPSTGTVLRQWALPEGVVRALAWSPEGTRLATATDVGTEIRIWEADTGTLLGEPVVAVGQVRRLVWSPDGARLGLEAGPVFDPWVEVHALGRPKVESLVSHAAGFTWAPDGSRFAAGLMGEVSIHVAADARVESRHQGSWGFATLLDWSQDGRWLAVGDASRRLFVLDAATGEARVDASQAPPTGSSMGFDAVRFHPTRRELVVVDDFPNQLDVLSLDVEARTYLRRELLAHTTFVEATAWSPTGALLASSGYEGVVQLWSPEGDAVRTLSAHGGKRVRALDWSRDGALLVTGGDDGIVRIWRAAEGTLAYLPYRHDAGTSAATQEVYRVALSGDARLMASVGGSSLLANQRGVIKVWSVVGNTELFRFPDGTQEVLALGWTPDGRYLVVVYAGVSWSIWDSQTRRIDTVDPGVDVVSLAAALSPDGTQVAVGGRPGLSIREIATGRLVAESSAAIVPSALSWSADGRRLGGGGWGGQVFVWDTTTPDLSRQVIGFHDESLSGVSWSPTGGLLATAGRDTALRVWRVEH
ncbi:WD40 repeat domain-containing protein [Myxococcus sp. K15C18031901]|uniref:WD40 repeat domain-containing protein n=1 Tax=Myxococcus dinghuensis TaxID=2906761 RepID=UPI0020A72A92|nr:WD40 repeat domain-containing protein [Myxococcus dinghuensis]MCP3100775.1 WD40 repeat domain-containing protein [Myxococcus dinghuensis]